MRRVISRNFALLALLLVTPVAAFAAGKCDRLIATGAAANPPFLWRDPQDPQRLIGANADLLKRITDSLGLKLDILYTGGRDKALAEVSSGRVDMLLDAILNVQQLGKLDFIHPAIAPLQTVAWVRNEPGFLYINRDDLDGKAGIRVSTSRFSDELDAFAKRALQLHTAPSLSQAVQTLLTGQADYVLHERYNAVAQASALGQLNGIVRLEPAISSESMHLAVSHDSACNGPWLRGQLAIKMTELRAAEVPQQLLSENLARWKEHQLESSSARPSD